MDWDISPGDRQLCKITEDIMAIVNNEELKEYPLQLLSLKYGLSVQQIVDLIKKAHFKLHFTNKDFHRIKKKLGVDYLNGGVTKHVTSIVVAKTTKSNSNTRYRGYEIG